MLKTEAYINTDIFIFSYAKEKDMTLSDFKFIFFMEWFHRLWGRGVGIVFALPALYFLKKGWISKTMKPRLAIFAALIGFQVRLEVYQNADITLHQIEMRNENKLRQFVNF